MSSSSTIFIFFVYGLAFFAMGMTITLQNRKFNRFLFANSLPLLAAFGITHGITEWMDMFILIRKETMVYTPELLDNFKLLFLILSFTFFLGFGFELLPGHSKIVKLLKWIIPPGLIAIWLLVYFTHISDEQIHVIGEIWGRYLFALSAGILSGVGILHNVYKNKKRNKTKVYLRYLLLAFSFIVYGFLAGLVVPDYPIFPASYFNYSNFIGFTHGLPVQLFRGLAAIFITIFTVESLALNEAEYRQINDKFEIQRSLTYSGGMIAEANVVVSQEEVIKLGRMLSHMMETPVIIINKSQNIIYANKLSESITGLKKESVLQKNIARLNRVQSDYPDIFRPLQKTLEGSGNIKNHRVNGKNAELTVSTYLFKTSGGFNKWVVGLFQFISNEKDKGLSQL